MQSRHGVRIHMSDALLLALPKSRRTKSGSAGPRERHYETVIRGILRRSIVVAQHPRTCIQVVLQVCREGGSELAAALNAAVAALMDACVPLHTLLAATCIAATPEGELLVDPSSQEQAVRECNKLLNVSVNCSVIAANPGRAARESSRQKRCALAGRQQHSDGSVSVEAKHAGRGRRCNKHQLRAAL